MSRLPGSAEQSIILTACACSFQFAGSICEPPRMLPGSAEKPDANRSPANFQIVLFVSTSSLHSWYPSAVWWMMRHRPEL